jgi:hypothetical protein
MNFDGVDDLGEIERRDKLPEKNRFEEYGQLLVIFLGEGALGGEVGTYFSNHFILFY